GRCVLQQEAARARPQRLVHVVVDVERGEHQDPRPVLPRRPGGAGGAAGGEQPAGGLQPVHLGHPHVHQHHVGPGAAAQLDAPGAVGGLAHHVDVALGGQQGGEAGPHHGLVVDDDDARRHVKSFPARGSRAATRKPPSGRGPTSRVPPTSRTRSRMPTSPCPVPPVSRGPPGGRGGGPLTTRTVRCSSPGPPSGSGSGSGTDRDTRVVAPGACRTTLARASWTIRYAESPTASGTSCSQWLNSTGPPALAVASTSCPICVRPGWGTSSPCVSSLRSTPSRRRISPSDSRAVDAMDVNSARTSGGRVRSRYSAVSACTVITDMWWATTSCSSRAMRARSSSSVRRLRS